MRVDEFDGTLVCDDEDLQIAFNYFKDFRKLPNYLESEIINLVLEYLDVDYKNCNKIEECLNKLPEWFIRNSILSINNIFRGKSIIDYKNFHLTYLMYYLPVNIYKIWKPLVDLLMRNTMKAKMKIVDIGTGPASVPIGIIEFYKEFAIRYGDIQFSLSFTFVEKENNFIDIANRLIDSIRCYQPPNLSITIDQIYNNVVTKDYFNTNLLKFDLITMSNFLAINEMDNSEQGYDIVKSLNKNLESDGSIVIINPGDEQNCRILKSIRNQLLNEGIYNLYSPCNKVWNSNDKYNCSCFNMTRAYWDIPKIFNYLSNKGLNKELRVDVPFNYLVLRKDGINKYRIINNPQHYIQLSKIKEKVGEIINIISMIRTVIYKGDNVGIALCDGTCDFQKREDEIWINIKKEDLIANNMTIPLISGERVTIRNILVSKIGETISLSLTKQSKIKIDY